MFSTLTIRDCALSASSKIPIPVSLKAFPSFPARASDQIKNPDPVPDSWAARGVPSAQGTLEVSLLERISEGRMGVTYSAHVMSATTDDGSSVTDTFPKTVCIKFAKPRYSRSLAREAWFYEQLAECQGTSVAQCHGFFSSTFDEQNDTPESLIPLLKLEHHDGSRLPSWSSALSSDWLMDDRPCDEYWDTRNFKRDSPWNTWDFSTQESPTISVLVLELLGEPCSEHWDYLQEEPWEGLKNELSAVMEDIATYGVIHNDVTAYNFLRFLGESEASSSSSCPRHNVVHAWRIVDFDRSIRVDMVNGGKQAKKYPRIFNLGPIGSAATFWGDCL